MIFYNVLCDGDSTFIFSTLMLIVHCIISFTSNLTIYKFIYINYEFTIHCNNIFFQTIIYLNLCK